MILVAMLAQRPVVIQLGRSEQYLETRRSTACDQMQDLGLVYELVECRERLGV